jgi:hypothetical protein
LFHGIREKEFDDESRKGRPAVRHRFAATEGAALCRRMIFRVPSASSTLKTTPLTAG